MLLRLEQADSNHKPPLNQAEYFRERRLGPLKGFVSISPCGSSPSRLLPGAIGAPSESMGECIVDEVGSRLQGELLVNSFAIGLNRSHAEVQFARNLSRRKTQCNRAQNLDFPPAQLFQTRPRT
jgi:hypothetical protein